MTGRPRGGKNIHLTIPMIRRMRELRRVGLSVAAVQAVIGLDYGEAPSEPTVRKYTSGWSPHAQPFTPGGNRGGQAGLTSGPADRKAF